MAPDDTGQDGAGKPAADALPDDQTPQASNPVTTADDQPAADDLLHAAYVPPPDVIASVELTLDHLSTTVDLFDIPPFDYGDTG
jgi:hypothetical protein